MAGVPNARELFDGLTDPQDMTQWRPSLNSSRKSARELRDEHSEYVEAITKATIAGMNGDVMLDTTPREGPASIIRGPLGDLRQVAPVVKNPERASYVRKAVDDFEMAKSLEGGPAAFERLAKEWTLTNPVSTGLIPYDLEAPAKLLTPRPTPIRNSTPRLKGQGGARRFKVISGFTGTATGGATTIQPGINESSTNSGPGGLSYIRGPYISYDGSIVGSAA